MRMRPPSPGAASAAAAAASGESTVTTPAIDVPVRRSFSDLQIECRRGNDVAMGTVVPRRHGLEQALVPFGSVAVAIDHISGHLYAYPTVVRLAHAVIGEAFSRKVLTPGVTTAEEVQWWYRDRLLATIHQSLNDSGCVIIVEKILGEHSVFNRLFIKHYYEMKKRRGDVPLFRYLRDTKDSDLVVLFGENSAAVLGLVIALAAVGLAVATGDARWDAFGSLLIGLVLIAVAIFLGREVMSLLLGERADPNIEKSIAEIAKTQPAIKRLIRVLTVQQGPGEVMVACKVHLIDGLDTKGVVEAIDAFEKAIHEQVDDIRWLFVEPDDDD
jgi:hypothetical protein